jgi:hypothetical protein
MIARLAAKCSHQQSIDQVYARRPFQPPLDQRQRLSNPHSACSAPALSGPRFPATKVFRRRPLRPTTSVRVGPASENLNFMCYDIRYADEYILRYADEYILAD